MTLRHSSRILVVVVALAARAAFGDPVNQIFFTSAEQFEFPATGQCDLVGFGPADDISLLDIYSLRHAAKCDLNESFYIHAFVTSLGDATAFGAVGKVGGILHWATTGTDVTNMACFKSELAAVDAAANYDAMSFRTTEESVASSAAHLRSGGASFVNEQQLYVDGDPATTATLNRASDGGACTATSCDGLPVVMKVTRLSAVNCCIDATTHACCTGVNTGSCTDITGSLWVTDVSLRN